MADATYQPKVYKDVGGDRLNVVSGGQVNLESGSSFSIATALEVASGGSVAVASGGGFSLASGSSCSITTPVEMVAGGYVRNVFARKLAGSVTAIVVGSVNSLTGSSTAPTVALPAPVSGGVIFAKCIDASSTTGGTITLTSTIDFGGTAKNKLKFDQDGEFATLVGTSAQWSLMHFTCTTTS